MNAATDTLSTAETLREAGVNERQSSAHARAMEEAVAGATGELVTRDHLRAELGAMENRLTWRLLGGIGLLLTLFRLIEWLTA